MGLRLALQQILENLLGNDHVYFQPPESKKMDYPCIRYKLRDIDTSFADDVPFFYVKSYEVTLIHRDPDNLVVGKLAALPKCLFDRAYTADNLNHYVYILYY